MSLRATPGSAVYVLAVGALAAAGFVADTPWPILLAALLTVPASLVAMPLYYLAYGLLALLPGANPSSSTGSGTVSPTGATEQVTGGAAQWFTTTTHLLGVLALLGAAVLDVLLVRVVAARRRSPAGVQRSP